MDCSTRQLQANRRSSTSNSPRPSPSRVWSRRAPIARERSVLLLGDGEDHGTIRADNARAYLEDLGVPLFVWAFEPIPTESDWGPIVSLGPTDKTRLMMKRLGAAVDALAKHLSHQRLVWIQGSHLPRDIELSPDARSLKIAGRSLEP